MRADWRGMQGHTAQMMSLEMVNASEAAVADGAAKMLVRGGFHGGLSIGHRGEAGEELGSPGKSRGVV